MSASTGRRIGIALLLGGLLLMSPPVVSGGIVWDIGIGFGYFSCLLILCLYVFPVRGDGLPHRRLLGLSQHRLLGWLTLGAALVHAGVLLGSQPSVGRYLLPSAPLFMWSGLVAVVLAGILVQTGLSARSAMRRSTSATAANRLATVHLALGALIILLTYAHIAGSSQTISGVAKAAAISLLLAVPLVWFALRPRLEGSHQSVLRRATHVSAAVLIPLMPSSTGLLLEPTASRPSAIEVNFPHDRHTSVNCVSCHHNFVDHTGVLACIGCHRTRRIDLPRSSEATFHVFCRDCHSRLALQGVKHGPTRACSGCHQGPR
jgi:hypothetical protein